MPNPKLRHGVTLTDDAVENLGSVKGLANQASDGRWYFNCLTVDPMGPYLHMTIEIPKVEGIELPEGAAMEVQIPHNYVRYIISAKDEWGVGVLAQFT